MPRYFSQKRPSALYVEDDTWIDPMLPSLTVPEHHATDTGLLDANGDAIMRAVRPVGFGRDDEW